MILKIPECSWKFELSYVPLWGEEKKQRHQLIVEGVTQFRREGAKCRLSVVEEDVERMSGIANIHYSKEDPPQVNVKIHVSKKDLFAFLEQLTIQYPPFKSIEVDFDGSSSVKIGYLKNEERIIPAPPLSGFHSISIGTPYLLAVSRMSFASLARRSISSPKSAPSSWK